MAVTINVLREKVAKINAKLEDHTRLRISLGHLKGQYTIALGSNFIASGLQAQDADNFLEGMRAMYFILSQSL